ncbi:MAG: hypothetical protein WD875_05215 [Pirellulales bacterium]
MSSSDDEREVPDCPFRALALLRNAAEIISANARNIVEQHESAPEYTTSSFIPEVRQAQRRADARSDVMTDYHCVETIRKGLRDFDFIESHSDALYHVQRAVALKLPPVFVGGKSYPTAHEAAVGFGTWMDDIWQNFCGDYAAEVAPDRMAAETEGPDADIAIEMNEKMWKKIERIRSTVPPDLWGQIQQEYYAASELLIDEEAKKEFERDRHNADLPTDENRLRPTDLCGDWLYAQYKLGLTWPELLAVLKTQKKKQFQILAERLNTPNSVKTYIQRYCESRGIQPPEPRQPGRPKKEK